MLILVFAAAVPESLSPLAKALAVWDVGSVSLLARTNKDSEMRSILFALKKKRPLHHSDSCLNLFYTFPSGKGFKLGLQPVLKSVFYMNLF